MDNTLFNFEIKGISYEFDLVHNLNDFGIKIHEEWQKWFVTTKDYSGKSFEFYIMEQNENYLCCNTKFYESIAAQSKPQSN